MGGALGVGERQPPRRHTQLGSERRGVDIPVLTPKFESTVPGIFVAGELGGMRLIRNALEQGRQAVDAIAERRRATGQELDLLIVGAGPSGFAATLTAKSKNMRYVTVEQEPPETQSTTIGTGEQVVVCDGLQHDVAVTVTGGSFSGFDIGQAFATATLVAPWASTATPPTV